MSEKLKDQIGQLFAMVAMYLADRSPENLEAARRYFDESVAKLRG